MWYLLDQNSIIRDVSDDWDDLACDGHSDALSPAKILGASLFSCVSGRQTQSFLAVLLDHCRETATKLTLNYRCDSLAYRREFAMTISSPGAKSLKINHQLVSLEPFSEEPIAHTVMAPFQCSMCLRLRLMGEWKDVLPPQGQRPHFGICPDCIDAAAHVMSSTHSSSAHCATCLQVPLSV